MPCNARWAAAENALAEHKAEKSEESLHRWLIAALEYISCIAEARGNGDLEARADSLIAVLEDANHSFNSPPGTVTQSLSAALNSLTDAVNVSGQINAIIGAAADFAEAVNAAVGGGSTDHG